MKLDTVSPISHHPDEDGGHLLINCVHQNMTLFLLEEKQIHHTRCTSGKNVLDAQKEVC